MVRQGGDLIAETDLEATPVEEEKVGAIYSEVILKNLSSYTTYKIKVAPITSSGIGKSSEPVYGGNKQWEKRHRQSLYLSFRPCGMNGVCHLNFVD